jgi:hypothetical protein
MHHFDEYLSVKICDVHHTAVSHPCYYTVIPGKVHCMKVEGCSLTSKDAITLTQIKTC